MIIVSKYLVPKGYTGMTVFPFVFVKTASLKTNWVLINHENIHLRQQLELLIIPFYLVYVLEFLVRLLQYRNWSKAYRNISFEREAYSKEFDLEYLNSRPFWAFLKYLSHNEF
ncbi:hypothetical protein [Seonamhaeicola marinus]|uniref:DUF4157 domain-containing protein n=1 Tax=Seonamhaeicola marinus TaxID=1912246 RepID=A0A5D0HUE7_9FLAO|nr:hypothetical protein [Seonamhaeicola marinus]TYA74994.1 hypothetical protein FUA24_16980 [Seonamhaeicola marinus]